MKKCDRCGNKILLEDKAVMLKTFQGNENLRSDYWHFKCFTDWMDESVEKKALNIYHKSLEKVVPSFNKVVMDIVDDVKATNQSKIL